MEFHEIVSGPAGLDFAQADVPDGSAGAAKAEGSLGAILGGVPVGVGVATFPKVGLSEDEIAEGQGKGS